MLFCFIVEESDRIDIVLEKKVRVGVVIIMNFYNGYFDGQLCMLIFVKVFKIYFFCLKILYGIFVKVFKIYFFSLKILYGIYFFVIYVNFFYEIRIYFL